MEEGKCGSILRTATAHAVSEARNCKSMEQNFRLSSGSGWAGGAGPGVTAAGRPDLTKVNFRQLPARLALIRLQLLLSSPTSPESRSRTHMDPCRDIATGSSSPSPDPGPSGPRAQTGSGPHSQVCSDPGCVHGLRLMPLTNRSFREGCYKTASD